MTSRPLFMSVAESIGDLAAHRPRRVRERLLDRDVLQLGARAAAERAAGGGQDELVDRPRPLAGEQLVQRRVLGVDGDDLRAGRLGERHDELAADDERLLVGQREVDALAQRRDGRAEAGRADERVEHEVGAGLEHEPHEALGPGEHLAVGPRLGGAGGGVRVGQRDRGRRRTAAACSTSASHERSADSPTSSKSLGALDDVERLRADRAGRAEDEEAAGHATPMGQGPGRLLPA